MVGIKSQGYACTLKKVCAHKILYIILNPILHANLKYLATCTCITDRITSLCTNGKLIFHFAGVPMSPNLKTWPGRWIVEDRWPSPNVSNKKFQLRYNGLLQPEPGKESCMRA